MIISADNTCRILLVFLGVIKIISKTTVKQNLGCLPLKTFTTYLNNFFVFAGVVFSTSLRILLSHVCKNRVSLFFVFFFSSFTFFSFCWTDITSDGCYLTIIRRRRSEYLELV